MRKPVDEPTAQERLQPALLDRLTDHDPHNQAPEPRDERVIGKAQLRQALLRDLAWLFNATRPSEHEGLVGHRHAERSVLNFGLPSLAGRPTSAIDVVELERAIRQAILDFEPRILASSLEVVPAISAAQIDRHNVVSIQINGLLWAQPVPLELLLQTDVDLETGEVRIRDLAQGR